MDEIYIQHRFKFVEGDLFYSDAIVLLRVDYENLSEEKIFDLKQAMFDNWKIERVKPPPIITSEEKLDTVNMQLNELKKRVIFLEIEKVELEAELNN